MIFHLRHSWLLALLLLFLKAAPLAAAMQAEASLSSTSFPLDRGVRLTIKVTGAGRGTRVELPDVSGIQIISRGQSSHFTMVNSQISSSINYSYALQGRRPGNFTLPPIRVVSADQRASTEPIEFTITPVNERPEPAIEENGEALDRIGFFRLSPFSRHYSGEIVPVTIKLYLSGEQRVEIDSLPQLVGEGVAMQGLSRQPQQTRETVDGRSYHVLIWQTTLSGIKTGEHQLFLTMDATLLLPRRLRSQQGLPGFGGSLFDDRLFDNLFNGFEKKPITITSKPQPFTVLALPEENRPPSFNGAIGEFDLAVSASPTRVEIGEPLTLTATITGTGNFDRVTMPLLAKSEKWKTYSPTATQTGQQKVFEQALVVKDATLTELAPLSFSYFNPKTASYISLTSEPIPLEISGGSIAGTTQAPPLPAKRTKDKAMEAEDLFREKGPQGGESGLSLAPQRLETGAFHQQLQPLVKRSWFLALSLFFSILWLIATVLLLLRRHGEKNPELQSTKRKKAALNEQLLQLKTIAAAGRKEDFLAASRILIQEHAALHCKIASSAVSLANLQQLWPADSLVLELFQLAETAVYAGAELSPDEMKHYSAKLEQALGEMP